MTARRCRHRSYQRTLPRLPALALQRQKKKKHVKSNVPQDLVVNAEEIKQKLGVE